MAETLGSLVDKLCTKCHQSLPIDQFYLSRGRPMGRCKKCHIAISRIWAVAHPDKMRAYARVSMRKRWERDPDKVRARLRAWRLSHPDHDAKVEAMRKPGAREAKAAILRAFRSGALVRPGACSECGADCKPDAHHPDYSKPLDVVWLCRTCHAKTWRVENRVANAG